MTKTYKSTTLGLVACGCIFHTLNDRSGSYYTTSDEGEQRRLESSSFFGNIYKLQREAAVAPLREAAVVPAEEEKKRENVYETSVLQEAREIVARVRAERGLKPRGMTNRQSVLNAAAELGLEFPNINS